MHSALNTELCKQLGCKKPIVQTGMGWVATPDLVVAVVEAGGFGFLAAATMTPEETQKAVREVKSRTQRPFGVNFHLFSAWGAGHCGHCDCRRRASGGL